MRFSHVTLFALVTIACVAIHPVAAQSTAADSSRYTLARTVVTKSGMGEAALEATFKSFPPELAAQMPAGFIDSLTVQMKRILPAMMDSLATVYSRHFTTDDLRQLSAFYDSPVGVRLAHELPAVQGEYIKSIQAMSMKVGQDLARQLMGGGQ